MTTAVAVLRFHACGSGHHPPEGDQTHLGYAKRGPPPCARKKNKKKCAVRKRNNAGERAAEREAHRYARSKKKKRLMAADAVPSCHADVLQMVKRLTTYGVSIIKIQKCKKELSDRELNPGLPRDRRGYSPLYYRRFDKKLRKENVLEPWVNELMGIFYVFLWWRRWEALNATPSGHCMSKC